jgi:hypothetical protein
MEHMEETKEQERRKDSPTAYLLFIAAVLVICMLPSVLLPVYSRARQTGSSADPEFSAPKLIADGRLNPHFLYDCAKQFDSHFAFRTEMISLQAGLTAGIFGESSADGVLCGNDGWLYYEATLDDYQHRNEVSDRMLFDEAHNVALMQEYTESLGLKFLFTVAPNKNSLYGSHMPARYRHQVADQSDYERLVPYLREQRVNYCDLFGLFRSQKEELYYKRDSHWNNRGALLVFNLLMDTAGTEHYDYGDCGISLTKDYTGDLERMLKPWKPGAEEQIRYDVKQDWSYVEGSSPEDDRIKAYNPEGSGNLLMYRDSFGNSLLPFCAQQYAQTVFSKMVPYPMTDLINDEPDTVIVEKVERHLPSLSEVPPLMDGALRDEIEVPDDAPVAASSSSEVYLTRNGSYLKFCGIADPGAVDPESRFYIEITDDEGYAVYEAFCCSVSRKAASAGTKAATSDNLESETEAATAGTGSADAETAISDYGYLLYLSDINVVGTRIRVRLIGEKDAQYTVLQDADMDVPQ